MFLAPWAPGLAGSWTGIALALAWKHLGLAVLLLLGAFRAVDESYLEGLEPNDYHATALHAFRATVTDLEALPPAQREAFLLHEEAGMSVAEIAAATGTNEEAAKSRLRYAMAKLRAAVDE